ncbi:hypothetical protein FE257_010022 [Aspergillus nanangensis]|uniref:Uncharacterized protein n=1 Tax=Aspergillus nanangensis TaxID=2582783 RepID=A0AAD4CY69_ASPNN|nr:hypothetical protein FE257_010022 [Aspergillus nanangensis]
MTSSSSSSMKIASRHVSKNSCSPECIGLAKEWLDDCLQSHSGYWKPGLYFLPTRVIDVGEHPGDLVRLHVPGGAQKPQYVALSYCWDSGNPLTTVQKTLKAHQKSIVFGSSSATFRDAVWVTQQLGIR